MSHAHKRSLRRVAGTAILALVGMLATTADAAQESQEAQDHVRARPSRPVQITPRLGPPGTEVSLRVVSMPAMTPVQLALGATSGFEALTLGYTTIDGDLSESVVVPEWSTPTETHRFIVFNLYFTAILAESAIFHVTDAEGRVERSGTITESGVGCLVLEDDDGERYRLSGEISDLAVGNRVSLTGTLAESTDGCGDDLRLDLRLAGRAGGPS